MSVAARRNVYRRPAELRAAVQARARELAEAEIERAGAGCFDLLLCSVATRTAENDKVVMLSTALAEAARLLVRPGLHDHDLVQLTKRIPPEVFERARRIAERRRPSSACARDILVAELDGPAEEIDPPPIHAAWWLGRRPQPRELAWISILAGNRSDAAERSCRSAGCSIAEAIEHEANAIRQARGRRKSD